MAADEHDLADASRAVAADVSHDFAAAGGMADEHDIAQVERLDHGGEVVGVVVHRVAVPGLARPAVPTPVMGDRAVAVRRHQQQLRIPGVRVERPAVAEHHWPASSPVLVEDRCSVLRDDRGHGVLLSGDCRDVDTMRDVSPSLRQSDDCRCTWPASRPLGRQVDARRRAARRVDAPREADGLSPPQSFDRCCRAPPGTKVAGMNLQRVARATLEVPAAEVDLESWLFGLSDEEYQACARGHHGAGVFDDERGRGMVNVESIGGNLIVQHYRPVRAERARTEMYSAASKVFLLHLVPVVASVRWTLDPRTQDGVVVRAHLHRARRPPSSAQRDGRLDGGRDVPRTTRQ